MAKNDFKPFATGKGANVTSQPDWEALPALLSGFTAGKASSAQVNKALRQASFIAAALAQYTASKSGQDVLDDGDLSGFIAKMSAAFGKDFQTLDATLTALAGLATGADKLPYFTGDDTAGQTDLTSVGRDIIGKASIADILTYLGLGETAKQAAGALQKSQNGGDIPDKDLFVRRIGAARAFDGAVTIGGDANPWTTAEFIVWLESQGAFNHPYWMCRGTWSYALNKVITDTGCGNICLAGAVIEVMGVRGAMTIRVTTPTTTSGDGVASAQFTYINNGDGYAPGWRRDFNTINKPTPEDVGALSVNGGRLNGPLGIGTDNALGGNSIVFGDNDTGIKQNGDGILDTFANSQHTVRVAPGEMQVLGAIRAGNAKRMTMTSSNNSVLNAQFNLWGDGNRPTVIELDDDQGWHLYSQRNTDGSIQFVVNGQVIPDNYGNFDARYLTSGNVYTKGESDNRYVQNIQRGAPVCPGKVDEYGPAEAPAGCFLTQARHDPTTAYGVTFAYRPLQMWVGNGWRTING
ncbi:TPA: phage tail protein [Salmonella enterica subsp. enterica serovar Muenchen]|nr:phage tail protein [Salmonella enterica subsp. enterica serovar Muenchen]HEC7515620.1 phage tail protein [Salmonella enterica subsp. enterica serovar Muenchen]HEC7578069.1 phage tail protein [Salmonella enterica subsp. enterica serovar Muenchen]HEC8713796.1 phage tail protein [Salmonella enterica subsp. enterica serovar Muenchen]